MTEREFDQKVERAAANFERRVETAADHLDKTVNRAWITAAFFVVYPEGHPWLLKSDYYCLLGVWRSVETELLRCGVQD